MNRVGASVTTPVKQLVAFARVYLEPGETTVIELVLDVDRYIPIINRKYQRELEEGEYVFALLDNASLDASTNINMTISCRSAHIY